ncbi:InlB B-repeat-containing protein [Comamonas terrigena]|uniref:InlB B-repeat-containing protein n=1 Tax=Comamonas terrigena TaxID=32013 RepID=UPI00289D89EA|nr:hypothetical protein [Comamonas terrigena]
MSNVRTTAGSTLLVCPIVPNPYSAAGFRALDFTEVGEITDFGEFGREYNKVTHAPVKNRRAVKRKGSFDEGSVTLPMARDSSDAGQKLLDAAALSDASYSYCIRLQDGTRFFFTAQCMSFKTNLGGVDSITGKSAQLEIDNDILEVAAASFTLEYKAGPNGSIQGVPVQTVQEGGTGTLVFAKADQGFKFEKWSDNKTDNPRLDVPVTANLTVTASFVAE